MACRRAATEATRAVPRFTHLLPQALTDSSPSSARLMRLHTVSRHATPGAGAGAHVTQNATSAGAHVTQNATSAGAHVTQNATSAPMNNYGGWGSLRANMSTWEVPVSSAEAASAQAASAQAASAQAASAQAASAQAASAQATSAQAASAQAASAQAASAQAASAQAVSAQAAASQAAAAQAASAQAAATQAASAQAASAAQQCGKPLRYHSMCRARWYASSAEGRSPPFFWRRRAWPFESRTTEPDWAQISRPGAWGPPTATPPPTVSGTVAGSGRPAFSPFADPLAWAQEVTRELSEAVAGQGRVLGKPWGVQEAAEEFRFKFGLPGVGKEGVRVRIQDSNMLTVEAKQQLEERGGSWASQTESWFQRKVRLPEGVKPQDVSAEMKDGVLTVKVPKVQPSPHETLAMDVPVA